jgi:hypothetical protein
MYDSDMICLIMYNAYYYLLYCYFYYYYFKLLYMNIGQGNRIISSSVHCYVDVSDIVVK